MTYRHTEQDLRLRVAVVIVVAQHDVPRRLQRRVREPVLPHRLPQRIVDRLHPLRGGVSVSHQHISTLSQARVAVLHAATVIRPFIRHFIRPFIRHFIRPFTRLFGIWVKFAISAAAFVIYHRYMNMVYFFRSTFGLCVFWSFKKVRCVCVCVCVCMYGLFSSCIDTR
jgi:hypothetical protein